LRQNVQLALNLYQTKYGQTATTCWTNPIEPGQDKAQGAGVTMKTSRSVLYGHLVVGSDAG
jgi:hypothetical protein